MWELNLHSPTTWWSVTDIKDESEHYLSWSRKAAAKRQAECKKYNRKPPLNVKHSHGLREEEHSICRRRPWQPPPARGQTCTWASKGFSITFLPTWDIYRVFYVLYWDKDPPPPQHLDRTQYPTTNMFSAYSYIPGLRHNRMQCAQFCYDLQ